MSYFTIRRVISETYEVPAAVTAKGREAVLAYCESASPEPDTLGDYATLESEQVEPAASPTEEERAPVTGREIRRLEFKNEGENADGLPVGPLTDQDAEPLYDDGRWVTKRHAVRLAEALGVDLFEY